MNAISNILKKITFLSSQLYVGKWISFIVLSYICALFPIHAGAQDSDSTLLNDYIKSQGFLSYISFDASNIKQYWINNSVVVHRDSIDIRLNKKVDKFQSASFPIQLKNINESFDCRIDIYSKSSLFEFSVQDNNLKEISKSSAQNSFLKYNVASAIFHMEDTSRFMFHLRFFSDDYDKITIDRIVLSFSKNKQSSFIHSPVNLLYSANDVIPSENTTIDLQRFIISGKQSQVVSKKNLFVEDCIFTSTVKVFNIGKVPTRVYCGFVPYSKNGTKLLIEHYPYQNINNVLTVVSAHKGHKTITVESCPPKWATQCHVVLGAKEDLSDIPNTSIVNGTGTTIREVKKLDNGHAEIIMNNPLLQDIAPGTKIRIHSTFSGYLYPVSKVLQPGEEAILTSTIKQDPDFLEYSSKAFSRGVYYVKPLIFSYSVNSNEENTIRINDFSVSLSSVVSESNK